jgi:hypothetical protein
MYANMTEKERQVLRLRQDVLFVQNEIVRNQAQIATINKKLKELVQQRSSILAEISKVLYSINIDTEISQVVNAVVAKSNKE